MYAHTQRGPVCLFFYGIAIGLFVAAWFARGEPAGAIGLAGVGVVLALAATCLVSLTVADRGEQLSLRFGLLPFFGTTVPYKDIQKVEIERWKFVPPGVHVDLGGNALWGLWGRRCVVVHQRRHTLRIGTDDADNLVRFLQGKMVQNSVS